MRTLILLLSVVTLGLGACSKAASDSASNEPASRINEASVKKAKALAPPQAPLKDVRPKLVELLGEPTATEGENLVWAGVTGDQCWELVLVVQGGEVKGTTSGSAHKLAKELHARCVARAGR